MSRGHRRWSQLTWWAPILGLATLLVACSAPLPESQATTGAFTPTDGPSAPSESAAATDDAGPDSEATASPVAIGEDDLVRMIREDARDRCAPRSENLPPLAIAGIECRPADPLVARVGVYLFANDRDAATAYLDRLASAGVAPNTGDCAGGSAGEKSWAPGDDVGSPDDPDAFVFGGRVLAVRRVGCFRDENGTANVRATCGDGIYVGVLGSNRRLAALYRWTAAYPSGAGKPVPTPPGICANPGAG